MTAKYRSADWLRECLLASPHQSEHPLFLAMLLEYLDTESASQTLDHAYWKSEEGGMVPVFHDLASSQEENFAALAKAAYASLPAGARVWLATKGVDETLVSRR